MSIAIISHNSSSQTKELVELFDLASVVHLKDPAQLEYPRIGSNLDLVVLEAGFPGEIEMTSKIMQNLDLTSYVPFLVVAPNTSEFLHAAYAFNATDFIQFPYSTEELALRIRNAFVLASRWESDRQVIRGLTVQMQQMHQWSREKNAQVYADTLTGLMTRKPFDEILKSQWLSCQRTASPLSVIKVNVDHFRAFNEEYGRSSGDRALRSLSNAIQESIYRPSDVVSRYSGSEIVVLLPQTPPKGAEIVAEKIRSAVAELGITHVHGENEAQLTVSQGVATLVPHSGLDSDLLMVTVNEGLEEAKKTGDGIHWASAGKEA